MGQWCTDSNLYQICSSDPASHAPQLRVCVLTVTLEYRTFTLVILELRIFTPAFVIAGTF